MTPSETDELLERAANHDPSAVNRLLAGHCSRLEQLVAIRMDERLRKRIDPADVVQETLLEAARRLPEYLLTQQIPFYPWLRNMAVNRLIDVHRRHALAQRRSVANEDSWRLVSDESVGTLAGRLAASATSPSRRLQRQEQREDVRQALSELPADDREILVLKYLEELSTPEMAAILQISERTVRRRHRLAIEELTKRLTHDSEERRRD